jgi:hypothetical protein
MTNVPPVIIKAILSNVTQAGYKDFWPAAEKRANFVQLKICDAMMMCPRTKCTQTKSL